MHPLLPLRLRTALSALAIVTVAGCGGDSPTASSPAASTVQTVVFAFGADLASFTTAGATAQVTAIGILTNGTTQEVTSSCANWQSDDPNVLSIASGGLMTARRASGSATITTTCQGVSARGLVTVNPPPTLLPPPIATPSVCPRPPYDFDPPPNEASCRGADGRYAFTVCCT